MSFENDDDENTNFQTIYQCYSTAFLTDRDRETIDNSGKIFLPESALPQLIHQSDVMLFKLTNIEKNRSTHCGVLEFLPNDEQFCYVPHWIMKQLNIDEGNQIHIESVHSLPLATFVCFQPQTKHFLDISNPKAVLERFLRNFSCLTKNDMITINYLNRNYELLVVDLKPANVVSIIDCDLEVDFTVPMDEIRTIDDKISTTIIPLKEREINRGKPDYNYTFGFLRFPRSIEQNSEKNSSKNFQPFTGEGNPLRQPRHQRRN